MSSDGFVRASARWAGVDAGSQVIRGYLEIAIPSEVRGCLAGDRPSVVGVRGDASDLVRPVAAGVACRPRENASIGGAVDRFAANSVAGREKLGRNGRFIYREGLSKARGIDTTIRLLEATAR